MTVSDFDQTDKDLAGQVATRAKSVLLSIITFIVMLVAVAFGAGVIAGFLDAGGENRLDILALIVVIWFAVIIGLTWLAAKLWPKRTKEPVAPSVKRSRNLIYLTLAISVVLGGGFGVMGGGGMSLFSNDPLPTYATLVFLPIWLVIIPAITLMWWRSTDEHDQMAYADGANIAGHAYLFLAPAWWIAARAGLVPQQDPMVVLAIVASIWSAVWYYKRNF